MTESDYPVEVEIKDITENGVSVSYLNIPSLIEKGAYFKIFLLHWSRRANQTTRWPLWSHIGWYIFDFSSETAERNSTKLDRKQDLNVIYHVFVFRADRNTRLPTWPLNRWGIFVSYLDISGRNLNGGKYSTLSGYSLTFLANHYQPVFHSKKRNSGARHWPFGPLVITDLSNSFFFVP